MGRLGAPLAAVALAVLPAGCVQAGASPALLPGSGSAADAGSVELPRPGEGMRLEIRLADRELHVFRGGDAIGEYPVAVGQPGNETPTGSWAIYQVDWNPDWNPPDSPWAEEREPKAPGHPDNPMGRVRMIFDPPYSIHGTDVLESLGEAASRGSIRMGNDDIIGFAPRVMEEGGMPMPEEWVRLILDDSTLMVQVDLPDPVPIDIVP